MKETKARTVCITFSAIGQTISEQLKSQGLQIKDATRYDKLNQAMNLLRCSGFLTDSASDGVRKKLFKAIVKGAKPIP